MNWSWGWELHPMSMEKSPEKTSLFLSLKYSSVILIAVLAHSIPVCKLTPTKGKDKRLIGSLSIS